MDVTGQAETEQAQRWNGRSGLVWVAAQELLDQIMEPFQELLLDAVAVGDRVLDVGCGAGSTTIAAADSVGNQGSCVGIDISDPMIAAARARAERESSPVSFVLGDAQTYAFEPAHFDLVISRFGVMFFDDSVAAFANLRRAARDNARMRLLAWRSAAENPFMTTAEHAAAPLLPGLPLSRSDEPGRFALADRDRLHAILDQSGWTDIDIQPIDVACTMPEKHLIGYATQLGPVGLVLPDVDEQTRGQVVQRLRAAFEPFVHADEVRFTAACWMVDARVGTDR